jgi:hypothetical protein
MLICVQHMLFTAESADQHQQSRLRQMEIRQNRTYDAKIESRINE